MLEPATRRPCAAPLPHSTSSAKSSTYDAHFSNADDRVTRQPPRRSHSLQVRAMPHILILKMHVVPIPQEARPARFPSGPDGLSDWWSHRADTTTACSCRSLIAAPDRAPRLIGFAAEAGSVVQPTPGRTEAPGLPHPSGLSAPSKSTSLHHRLACGPFSDSPAEAHTLDALLLGLLPITTRSPYPYQSACRPDALYSQQPRAPRGPSTRTSCSPCWSPRLADSAQLVGALGSQIVPGLLEPSTRR